MLARWYHRQIRREERRYAKCERKRDELIAILKQCDLYDPDIEWTIIGSDRYMRVFFKYRERCRNSLNSFTWNDFFKKVITVMHEELLCEKPDPNVEPKPFVPTGAAPPRQREWTSTASTSGNGEPTTAIGIMNAANF